MSAELINAAFLYLLRGVGLAILILGFALAINEVGKAVSSLWR